MRFYKKILYFIAIIFIILITIYLSFNTSYKISLKARMVYFMGNYEQALDLANKAYQIDPYNKMAFSIITQIKIAKTYQDFIASSLLFLKKIETISMQKSINQADKSKIRLMCDVALGEYEELSPTTLIDENLIKNAKFMQKTFIQIKKELFDE